MGMRGARQNNAIERSQLAKKAKPLGELIVAASRGKIPPPPTIPVLEKSRDLSKRRKGSSEAPVLHDCLRYLKKRGIFAWRNNSGTLWTNGQPVSFGYPGSPDIIGILPDGTFLGVECKSATGRQSEKQKKFQQRASVENQGVYILARSVEDLERGLE